MKYLPIYDVDNNEVTEFIKIDYIFSFGVIQYQNAYYIEGSFDKEQDEGRIMSIGYKNKTDAMEYLCLLIQTINGG